MPTTGGLEVSSEPSGASVTIDGVKKGVTPLALAEITPGQHRIAVSSGRTTVNRSVDLKRGATASVMVSVTSGGSPTGWVSIETPFEMQVLEGGRVLGTGSAWRLMLPAGRHQLEFVSKAYDFRTVLPVDVARDRTVPMAVTLPMGSLSVSALPWADVSLDGKSIGQTPLGNLAVPIGSHEVVWRHPQLGERRQTVSIGTVAPVRVGTDWTR
jgi:serine/threonine-protein kinase